VNADPTGPARESTADSPGGHGGPGDEELRAAYEAELNRITAADMMLQAAVTLLNIGGRRLGLVGRPEGSGAGTAPAEGAAAGADERDLGQVRDAIDGVRALLGILERTMSHELRPLRDALSQLQIAYAREVQAGPRAEHSGGQSGPAGGGDEPDAQERPRGPGPAQASGRLWVPGS
jgi:hypothetical protein